MDKFDYFTTSDGRLWVVRVRERKPEWTTEQERLARNTIIFGIILTRSLVGLLFIFIGYKIFGA